MIDNKYMVELLDTVKPKFLTDKYSRLDTKCVLDALELTSKFCITTLKTAYELLPYSKLEFIKECGLNDTPTFTPHLRMEVRRFYMQSCLVGKMNTLEKNKSAYLMSLYALACKDRSSVVMYLNEMRERGYIEYFVFNQVIDGAWILDDVKIGIKGEEKHIQIWKILDDMLIYNIVKMML